MTTETFMASNGIGIDRGAAETRLTGTEPGQVENRLEDYDYLSNEDMDALREYFLAERDEETPYSVIEGTYIIARFFERELAEEFVKKMGHKYMRVLPEEPKPWHTPNHLEIWALTIQGCPREAYIYRESSHPRVKNAFRPVNREERVQFAPTDPEIVDAHRIWPES